MRPEPSNGAPATATDGGSRHTVVHYTDTAGFGGAERMLLTILAGFVDSAWHPVLLVHDHPGVRQLVEEARALGVATHTVPRMTRRRGLTRLPAFMRELARLNPVLFHAHLAWPLQCTHALVGAFLMRIPTVVTQQLYVQLPSRREAWAEKIISLVVSRYVAVSRHVQLAMQQRVLLPGRVTVVHNAIRIPLPTSHGGERLREELLGRSGGALVLTLARLDFQKGLGTLVRAAAQVPEATFVIAGEGPERERLEEAVRSLALEGRFLLLGHRTDVTDLLAACDLFVLPSEFEGLPVSVLEAMAAGKPVVVTDVGGSNEVVRHEEQGLLVPVGDGGALASAIRRVLSDRVLSRRLATAGRERVSHEFSADVLMARLRDIYAELVNHGPSRRVRRVEAA